VKHREVVVDLYDNVTGMAAGTFSIDGVVLVDGHRVGNPYWWTPGGVFGGKVLTTQLEHWLRTGDRL
jgi:hypothetical protein